MTRKHLFDGRWLCRVLCTKPLYPPCRQKRHCISGASARRVDMPTAERFSGRSLHGTTRKPSVEVRLTSIPCASTVWFKCFGAFSVSCNYPISRLKSGTRAENHILSHSDYPFRGRVIVFASTFGTACAKTDEVTFEICITPVHGIPSSFNHRR